MRDGYAFARPGTKHERMSFDRIRFARLDTIIRALHSVPARAIFERLKTRGLAHGDEVAQYRSLAEIINSELDELDGTRPGLDEPERWWEAD
jgi:hypothetical protein